MTKQMKQTEWEKRFDKLADDLFVRNVTTPDIDTDIHLGDSEEACDKVKAFIKQEIKGILNLDIFANKYSSRFVNKGILMAYDAIKEHIEGKKEEPKGEQSKCLTRFKNGGSVVLLKKAGKDKFKGIRKYNK